MFASLQGKVSERRADAIVLETGGIGFLVYTNAATIARAGQVQGEFKVYTHLIVREGALDLCGFSTKEELTMFQRLIGVSGVGAKSAIVLLSQMSVSDLSLALVSQDAKAISKAPGIGLKTAQKIILELKDKVTEADMLFGGRGETVRVAAQESYVQDAIEALAALGYPTSEAAKAVSSVKGEASTADELIRLALRRFG